MHNVNFLLFQACSLKNAFLRKSFTCNLFIDGFQKEKVCYPTTTVTTPGDKKKIPKPHQHKYYPNQQSLNLETILQSKPGWKRNNNKISSFSLKVERHMQFFPTSGEAQDEIPRVRQKSHSNCNHQSFLLFTLGGRKMLERLEIRNALEILFQ